MMTGEISMASTPRIAVVGSANTDLITFSDAFPRAGETLFGKSFDLGFGGKGANQAIAARLCGAEVLRSEEHTSELQSQSNLVCRLLLEKKKYITGAHSTLADIC